MGMKSLEIVNLCLEDLVNNKTEICEYDLLEIKQDLEVLEIINEVVFERVGYYKIKGNSPKYRTITIRDKDDRFIKIELSAEQLLKLKQWLEENEK